MKEKFDYFRRPLEPNEIEWKIQSVTKDKSKTVIVPYIDNRAVMSRLDEAFGVTGWRNEYKLIEGHFSTKKDYNGNDKLVSSERGFVCGISIKCNQEWITKYDIAETSSIEPLKGGASDSMKRCSTQWGLGRELYDYPRIFVKGEQRFIDNKIIERLHKMTEARNSGTKLDDVYVL